MNINDLTPNKFLPLASLETLGYEWLSLEQREAIMHFVADQDAFVSISTGW